MLLALLVTAAATTAAPSSSLVEPLAPAADGKMQCYAPNVEQKTCHSLAMYAAKSGGKYENTAIVLVSGQPFVVLRTVLPVELKGDAVCGTISDSHILASEITVGDQVLPSDQAQPMLGQMVKAMHGVIGHEICTRYVTDGDRLIAKATMDGVAQPDEALIWVGAQDGYQVKP